MARTLSDAGFELADVPRETSRSLPEAVRLSLLWVALCALLALCAILAVKLVDAKRALDAVAPTPTEIAGPLRGGVAAPPFSARRVWLPAGTFNAGSRLKAWLVVEEAR